MVGIQLRLYKFISIEGGTQREGSVDEHDVSIVLRTCGPFIYGLATRIDTVVSYLAGD